MRTFLLAACCVAGIPGVAFAADIPLPACALHLAESPVGGVLTQAQIDTNNSCITTLQQETAVAETVAKIEEANRRGSGKSDRMDAALRGAPSPAGAIMLGSPPALPVPSHVETPGTHPNPPSSPAPATPASAAAIPPPAPPPVVDGIMWDGSAYTAILGFPDGSSMEVRRGTTLPDGATVAIVSQSGVYTESNHTIRPLRSAGSETSTPASTPAPTPALPSGPLSEPTTPPSATPMR